VRRVLSKFFADRGTHLAAMIAYFALLSLVPLLFLALALLGLVHQADENSFFVRELSKTFPDASINSLLNAVRAIQANATALGIATVYQDLALCDNLDVVANLFLGREEESPVPPVLKEEDMERRAVEVLKSLSVKLPHVRTPIAALSGGQRQSVAVSRSVMWAAKVVLLDEPTAALGVAQTKQVLELIRRLKEQGLGVVVISHNLADVFEVCDRIVVLRLGKRIADFRVADATREQVVAAITGATLDILKTPEEPK